MKRKKKLILVIFLIVAVLEVIGCGKVQNKDKKIQSVDAATETQRESKVFADYYDMVGMKLGEAMNSYEFDGLSMGHFIWSIKLYDKFIMRNADGIIDERWENVDINNTLIHPGQFLDFKTGDIILLVLNNTFKTVPLKEADVIGYSYISKDKSLKDKVCSKDFITDDDTYYLMHEECIEYFYTKKNLYYYGYPYKEIIYKRVELENPKQKDVDLYATFDSRDCDKEFDLRIGKALLHLKPAPENNSYYILGNNSCNIDENNVIVSNYMQFKPDLSNSLTVSERDINLSEEDYQTLYNSNNEYKKQECDGVTIYVNESNVEYGWIYIDIFDESGILFRYTNRSFSETRESFVDDSIIKAVDTLKYFKENIITSIEIE